MICGDFAGANGSDPGSSSSIVLFPRPVDDTEKLRSTTLRFLNVSKRLEMRSRRSSARRTVSFGLIVGLLLIVNVLRHDITE
jgi:hypothetical protein